MQGIQDRRAQHAAAANMSDILYMVTGFGTGYLGAMDHPKALGDVFESLLGAVFVDTGFDLVRTLPVRLRARGPLPSCCGAQRFFMCVDLKALTVFWMALAKLLDGLERAARLVGPQVVMKMLGNLEGVSPNTYPKPPYDIINHITLKAGFGYVTLVSVVNDVPIDQRAVVNPNGQEGEAAAAAPGAGLSVAPARVRHLTAEARRELAAAEGLYRGRARVHNIWLSSVFYGETRRVVRARCSEQVLAQLQCDPKWLAQLRRNEEDGSGMLEIVAGSGAAVPDVVVATEQGINGVDGELRGGVFRMGESKARLPSIQELQHESDPDLDAEMAKALARARRKAGLSTEVPPPRT